MSTALGRLCCLLQRRTHSSRSSSTALAATTCAVLPPADAWTQQHRQQQSTYTLRWPHRLHQRSAQQHQHHHQQQQYHTSTASCFHHRQQQQAWSCSYQWQHYSNSTYAAAQPSALHHPDGADTTLDKHVSSSIPATAPGTGGDSSSSTSTSTSTTTTSSSSSSSPVPPLHDVVYHGHFSRPLQRLKQASLLNTAVSLAAAPFILLYSGAAPLASVAVASSLVGFGLLTTTALHWFTSTYCHSVRYTAAEQRLDVETLTLLARKRQRSFQLADVAYPDGLKPLATFQAKGRTYYIDKNTFPDQDLLQLLTPPHPQAAAFEALMQQQQQPGQTP